jgi:hypothetical protein
MELQNIKLERELGIPAALIPEAELKQEARRFGIEPALGAQLVNEVMPAYSDLAQAIKSPITISTGPIPKSASAT